MGKLRIGVLYGGRADEHPISCISAAGMLEALDAERFEPVLIGITREGTWITDGVDPRELAKRYEQGELPSVEETADSRRVTLDLSRGSEGFYAQGASLGRIDVVFPVLHGPFGEDGTVQGLLEMMGVPYVGCGVLASAACMDKYYTKILLNAAGIPTAPGIMLDTRLLDTQKQGAQAQGAAGESGGSSDTGSAIDVSANDVVNIVADARMSAHTSAEVSAHTGAAQESMASVMQRIEQAGLHFPLFVKPSRAGSSFGVTKVERHGDEAATLQALADAVAEARTHDWRVLIEQGIAAREIECAVLAPRAGEEPLASLPGEVVLDKRAEQADQFYDFDSKYMDASASHVEVPASLPEETLERVRSVARRAFKAVDGAGLSRVDTFVTSDGEVMVNEINTMPGFTPISMYAKAWAATGVSYTELISRLIDGALASAR